MFISDEDILNIKWNVIRRKNLIFEIQLFEN